MPLLINAPVISDIFPALYTAPPLISALLEPDVVDSKVPVTLLSLYSTLSIDVVVPAGLFKPAPLLNWYGYAGDVPDGSVTVPLSIVFVMVSENDDGEYLYFIV